MDRQALIHIAKTDQRVPLVIAGLFVICTASVFITNLTHLLRLPKPATVSAPVISRPVQHVDMGSWHLFGNYEASLANVPQTQLQLTLQGTDVTDSTNMPSTAIIADSSGKAKVYQVGDAVPGGATLYKIFPHHVIFNHNGNYEMLKLPLPKQEADNP